MKLNETLKKQLDHRTIRAFKEQILSQEQLVTLLEVARHTSTSMFMQGFSVMHITDPKKRAAIRNISTQPYVGANGDLFIFINLGRDTSGFNHWRDSPHFRFVRIYFLPFRLLMMCIHRTKVL